MKFQIEHHYPIQMINEVDKLKRMEAMRLMYDFVNGLPEEQFNSIFNFELLNPTQESFKMARKMKDGPLFSILRMLKEEEKFKIHLHINL
jgi:hypothetical protein